MLDPQYILLYFVLYMKVYIHPLACTCLYVWELVYPDHSIFWIVCQYGRKDDDKAATTPLVEHAPAPQKGKKGKKDGKKDARKDKLEDLKQELEMVHSIKMWLCNYVISMALKFYTYVYHFCNHPPFTPFAYSIYILIVNSRVQN